MFSNCVTKLLNRLDWGDDDIPKRDEKDTEKGDKKVKSRRQLGNEKRLKWTKKTVSNK